MATGWWKRHVGLDFVDTVIHGAVTLFTAFAAAEFGASGDDGGMLAVVFGTSVLLFGYRRNKAMRELAQQPPETTGEAAAQRVYELEARVAELEFGQQRLQELEERLDFAERLLAKRAEPARLEEPR